MQKLFDFEIVKLLLLLVYIVHGKLFLHSLLDIPKLILESH